jgi:hypothetical protein
LAFSVELAAELGREEVAHSSCSVRGSSPAPVDDILHTRPLNPARRTIPRAYAYNVNATIIAGSYAGRPCPSARYAP